MADMIEVRSFDVHLFNLCTVTPNNNLITFIWLQRLTGKSPDNLEELREIAFDDEDEDEDSESKNEDTGSDLEDEETNTEAREVVAETEDNAASEQC